MGRDRDWLVSNDVSEYPRYSIRLAEFLFFFFFLNFLSTVLLLLHQRSRTFRSLISFLETANSKPKKLQQDKESLKSILLLLMYELSLAVLVFILFQF